MSVVSNYYEHVELINYNRYNYSELFTQHIPITNAQSVYLYLIVHIYTAPYL